MGNVRNGREAKESRRTVANENAARRGEHGDVGQLAKLDALNWNAVKERAKLADRIAKAEKKSKKK